MPEQRDVASVLTTQIAHALFWSPFNNAAFMTKEHNIPASITHGILQWQRNQLDAVETFFDQINTSNNKTSGTSPPGKQQEKQKSSSSIASISLTPQPLRNKQKIKTKATKLINGQKEEDGIGNNNKPIVCIEFTRGKRRVYYNNNDKDNSNTTNNTNTFHVRDDYVTHRRRLRDALADYLLPQGFPDSVAPQYAKYMGWRGVQYFFGGAMSVFTTRSLLGAVGVANRHSGEAAAAINWVVKDGAGRMGRFLFARWGRELDCELKQFRLGGDILMETGAALELSTALAPRLFLPLACTANLAKNLAAVAASSTRAPIYRTFAKENNLADVTAKGESVANLADVLGTICGIILAKANLPVVPTFACLSVGYLLASRREVDSVELPYLNRARLSYAARAYLRQGVVPGPAEANREEPLLPWSDPTAGHIVLGATVEEACGGPEELRQALQAFKGKKYALTYRPETKKVYVMLREGAGSEGTLQGALLAHSVLQYIEQGTHGVGVGLGGKKQVEVDGRGGGGSGSGAVGKMKRSLLQQQYSNIGSLYKGAMDFISTSGGELISDFEKQSKGQGWRLPLTMLNPSETRLHVL